MKSVLPSAASRRVGGALLMCLLAGCTLPPRDAMRVIQSEGLVAYLTGTYNPGMLQSRYLGSQPLMAGRSGAYQRVPYRPMVLYADNRYMGAPENRVPYRPRTSRPRSSSRSSVVTSKPEDTQSEAPPVSRPAPEKKLPPVSTPPGGLHNPGMDSLPYGSPVAGRPGMVTSPFAQKQQLVDVTGMAPGETVKDPYTGKLFRVPPTQQASAAPSLPEPAEKPVERPQEKTSSPDAPEAPKTEAGKPADLPPPAKP